MELSALFSTMKLGFMFCSVASVVLAMNLLAPAMTELAEAAMLCFQSCLKPPYLYFVVNFIIIFVAASSRFRQPSINYQYSAKSYYNYNLQQNTVPPAVFAPVTHSVPIEGCVLGTPLPMQMVVNQAQSSCCWAPEEVLFGGKVASLRSEVAEPEATPEKSTHKPAKPEKMIHRKNSEPMLEDLKEAPITTTETLESVWSKIEGSRESTKLDTWSDHNRQMNTRKYESQRKSIKSETFNYKNRTVYDPRLSASTRSDRVEDVLTRESSPSQDELNQRVEAFISKFNVQMRLQRQQSIQQHNELLRRGVY